MQPDENALEEHCFIALSQYQALWRDQTEQAVQRQVVFNDIAQLAMGNPAVDHRSILATINQSVVLRRAYQRLLTQFCMERSRPQAAASTALAPRESDGMRLNFKADKFNPEQVYALLTLHQPSESQCSTGVVLNVVCEDAIYRLFLPPVSDHQTQLLFHQQDQTFVALSCPASEIIIMPK